MKVPTGTQQDKVLRLKGLGFPSLKVGDRRPDLHCENRDSHETSSKQKQLLEEFAKESGYTADAEGEGFSIK